jgi:hypothetical protein
MVAISLFLKIALVLLFQKTLNLEDGIIIIVIIVLHIHLYSLSLSTVTAYFGVLYLPVKMENDDLE